MKKILILFIFISSLSFAQEKDSISIFQCYDQAIKEFSIAKNILLVNEIGKLKAEMASSKKLPDFNLNAQATYQSDVIDLEPVLSNLNPNMPAIDALPNDQYKMYVEAKQLIYDGGLIKGMQQIEYDNAKAEAKKIDVQIFEIYERVNANYYNILMLQKQNEVLELFINEIGERIKVLEVAKQNGTINQSVIDVLKSELLNLEQQKLEIDYTLSSLRYSLSKLIGQSLDNLSFIVPFQSEIINDEIKRPELELFNLEKIKLEKNSELLSKKRYPIVAGFGQFGYGRPALNMLNPDFDDYYLLGINIKWNIWDWGEVKKSKQMLNLTKEMITNQEEGFREQIEIRSGMEKEQILKLEELIKKDNEIIELKTKIVDKATNELENGTITSTQYLTELNAKKKAELNKVVHEIELSRSKIKLRTILGQI